MASKKGFDKEYIFNLIMPTAPGEEEPEPEEATEPEHSDLDELNLADILEFANTVELEEIEKKPEQEPEGGHGALHPVDPDPDRDQPAHLRGGELLTVILDPDQPSYEIKIALRGEGLPVKPFGQQVNTSLQVQISPLKSGSQGVQRRVFPVNFGKQVE